MINTTAKFKCQSVTQTENGTSVILEPVTQGSLENESFFRWTPWGKIEMGTINPDVEFIPGKEYYVDFTEAK